MEGTPEDRELQDEVLRLGLVADDLERVAQTFECVVQKTQNALLKSFLRLRLGHLYGQALARPQEAVRVYSDLLVDDPSHEEARKRLEPLLERLGRKDEQAQLLESILRITVGTDRFRVFDKLERVYAQLGREEDVQRVEKKRVEETGERFIPSQLVADLDEGGGSWAPSVADKAKTRLETKTRLQRLEVSLESPIDDVSRRAFITLARLSIDDESELDRAEVLAERGLERFPTDATLLELVEETYRRQQRWDAVVTVLRRRLRAAEDLHLRVAVRKTLAELFEAKLDDANRALETLQQAEEEGVFDLDLSRSIERLQLERGDWSQVRQTLEKRLEKSEDARVQALTRASLARLAYDVERDVERAWYLLMDARSVAYDEPDVLELAAEVAARRHQIEEAIELYERVANLVDGPRASTARAAAGKLALYDLKDILRAEAIFEAAVAADAACLPAVEALADIAIARSDWNRALTWLVRSAELSTEEQVRVMRLVQAGETSEERLGDDRQAVVLYESAVELDPTRWELHERIGALLAPRDPRRAALHYELAGSVGVAGAKDRARCFERAGQLARRVEDATAAARCFRAALALEPQRRASLLHLSEILEESSEWDELYERSATFLLWHEDRASSEEKKHAYARMAKARLELGEHEAAVRFARQAVALESSFATVSLLADALEQTDRPEEAGDARRMQAQLEPRADTKVRCLARAGELFERAENPSKAAVVLDEALRLSPGDEHLCRRLAKQRHLLGDDLSASEAYQSRAAHLTGADRAAALREAGVWVWAQN
ncbi:MAG: hypothetical protein HC923_07500, partial [Myxococcales bacterium]|nr:hypothetical protein [Myxococcales bacterium]